MSEMMKSCWCLEHLKVFSESFSQYIRWERVHPKNRWETKQSNKSSLYSNTNSILEGNSSSLHVYTYLMNPVLIFFLLFVACRVCLLQLLLSFLEGNAVCSLHPGSIGLSSESALLLCSLPARVLVAWQLTESGFTKPAEKKKRKKMCCSVLTSK